MSSIVALLPLYIGIAICGIFMIAIVLTVREVSAISRSLSRTAAALEEVAQVLRARSPNA